MGYDVNAPSERMQWHRLLLALDAVGGKIDSLGGFAIRDLRDQTGVEIGSSSAAGSAERRGLIARKIKGKRTYRIALTDAGRDLLNTTLIPRYSTITPPSADSVEPAPVDVGQAAADWLTERFSESEHVEEVGEEEDDGLIVVEPEPLPPVPIVDTGRQVTVTLTGTPAEITAALATLDAPVVPDSRLDHVASTVHQLDLRVDGLYDEVEALTSSFARVVDMVQALHDVWIGEPEPDERPTNITIPGALNGNNAEPAPEPKQRPRSMSKIAESQVALRAVSNKDWRDLLRSAARQGCTLTIANNGHIRVVYPDGTKGNVSQTPSDFRAIKKQRSVFRQHGIAV